MQLFFSLAMLKGCFPRKMTSWKCTPLHISVQLNRYYPPTLSERSSVLESSLFLFVHCIYDIDDLIPIIESNSNIKYFAVSNIHSAEDLKIYLNAIPKHVIIVPKIESVDGVSNVKQITDALGIKKILMLDHDDLYSSIISSKQPASKFLECFNILVDYCNNHNIILLRTIGVVFSDQEKRITDYIG